MKRYFAAENPLYRTSVGAGPSARKFVVLYEDCADGIIIGDRVAVQYYATLAVAQMRAKDLQWGEDRKNERN